MLWSRLLARDEHAEAASRCVNPFVSSSASQRQLSDMFVRAASDASRVGRAIQGMIFDLAARNADIQ
jgi:hypothetical protein